MDKQLSEQIGRVVCILSRDSKSSVSVSIDNELSHSGYHLLWSLKNRRITRYLLAQTEGIFWKDVLQNGEETVFILPYENKRPLFRYLFLMETSPERRKELCTALFALCMDGQIMWPVLYLLLKEETLNIRSDYSVYFTYDVNPGELDTRKDESHCVLLFAELLLKVLKMPVEYKTRRRYWKKEERNRQKLLEKRLKRKQYRTFLELYQDYKKPVPPKQWFCIHKKIEKRIFKILLVMAVLLVLLALIALSSKVFLGEIPMFRLFTDTFYKVGTETLGR